MVETVEVRVIQVTGHNGGQASGNVNGTSGIHQVVVRIKQRAGLRYDIRRMEYS